MYIRIPPISSYYLNTFKISTPIRTFVVNIFLTFDRKMYFQNVNCSSPTGTYDCKLFIDSICTYKNYYFKKE